MENYTEKEEEKAEICLNCKYFGEVSSWSRKDIPCGYLKNSGECRCKSPQINKQGTGVELGAFPIVKEDMWCGEFKGWFDEE